MSPRIALCTVATLYICSVCATNRSSASETLACRQLADLVAADDVDLAKAKGLVTAAGSSPQLKCVAGQAMALLLIRSNQFSEAWKQLAALDSLIPSVAPAIGLQQKKLKLWLLIEAGSPRRRMNSGSWSPWCLRKRPKKTIAKIYANF